MNGLSEWHFRQVVRHHSDVQCETILQLSYTQQKSKTQHETISKILLQLQFIWGNQSIEINKNKALGYGFHMTGNTDMQKGRSVDQKTSQYLVWPLASCSATHLLLIELIRLLIVACGMLSHSFSMCEVGGYWQELEHAVVHVDPEHPTHAQWVTCLLSMQAMEELGRFQLLGIVYRSLWNVLSR